MDEIFAQAWNLGGFAVAFVVAMWMLRESFKQRVEERQAWTAKLENDRDSLSKVLSAAAVALQRMTDRQEDAEDKSVAATTTLAAALDRIGANMDKTAVILTGITQSLDAASVMGKTDKTELEHAIEVVHVAVVAMHEDVRKHRRAMEKRVKDV